ncbi:complement C3-like [Halichoeres trimaculatus]|uniref:complement C3-like n=1 Tax=Halichoeres trimaculatus TaxID=147232 RepID=UPI003D9EB5C3
MCWSSLWPLAFVVFSPLVSQAFQPQLEVMSAPNLLRVGVAEKIFVEIQDCTFQHEVEVNISVRNHPTKVQLLASTLVTLRARDNYQNFGEVTIPARYFSRDPNQKHYVYLQAKFPGQMLERIVLVSFQFGFIFIQTDKTIYTPESSVLYRLFGVTPGMKPVERGHTDTDASVAIEIVNPDGITVETSLVSLESGMYSYSFPLGKIVSSGQWKVVAKYQSNPQQSFTAPFEVKEYVLPTFEVKLIPSTPFFYVDDTELNVTIEAKYLFGEEVDGSAWVVFGYMDDEKKSSFPSSVQRQAIIRGTGTATLKREHMNLPNIDISKLVNKHIYVSVSVLTHSGDEMVAAEKRGIPIVTSPYTIHFRRTPSFFKPGFYFDLTIEVLNPDETPAPNVDVLVEAGSQALTSQTEANGMARLTINTDKRIQPLNIKAKTNAPKLSGERQATATMEAQPYRATNNQYIHIGLDRAEVTLHENIRITYSYNILQNEVKQITHLILSRGQLISYGSHRTTGQVSIGSTLRITKEMMPSFRIIAYYHTSANQVVSDSLWIDVKDSCMGSLKLEDTRSGTNYQPRYNFKMKVTGDPGARVGLVAVDKGVYVLNDKHRLTQKKIWDVVEKFDTGCTPGGGQDNMGVFYDAGLLFVSSTSATPYRQELKCPATTSRKKRAGTMIEVRTNLLSNYEEKLPRECCLDGMSDTPVSYSCERRSEYISKGQDCVEAFLRCCNEMERLLAEKRDDELQMSRSETNDDIDSIEVVSRSKFPESWFWVTVDLPSCSPSNPDCGPTAATKYVPLPDSITTWQFTGISLSRTHGICVADPFEVVVKKDFFIDLKVPYSAIRGEQLEIKAVIHNYSPIPVEVRVEMKEQENLCSLASKQGKYREEVRVANQSTRAVFFILIPMRDGQFPIVVRAIAKNAYELNDEVTKMLRVVSDGVLVKTPRTIKLHLAEGGRREITINSEIPTEDMVPNTYKSTLISVSGREQLSNLLQSAISGKSMESMIRAPYGCGEQNAASMTLPLIAAVYLDKTNQWEAVGLGKRDEALMHIRHGYQSELKYRNSEGAFSVFEGSEGSSWLTAYVVKVFAMASNLVEIDRSVICSAVRFLVLKAQQPDGMFVETGYVYSDAMRGGVLSTNSDVSMTAFCLIAMQESRTICDGMIDVTGSINKAVNYIQTRLPRLTYPYAVAIASYALANENKLNLRILTNFMSGSSHWRVPGSNEYTLEGTAYGLLALVRARELERAKPVVRWFSQQNRVDSYHGSYGSTQATIMVYQAVAEYWANAEEPEYDLNIDMTLPGKSLKLKFNKGSQFSTRTSEFNNINQDVTIVAEGAGEATVTMVSMYYALPSVRESNCQKFNLSVQVTPVKADEEEKVYKLTIQVMFKDPDHKSTMAIVDVGLPTGFEASSKDLDKMSQGHARTIQKYERNSPFSEKSNIIIYLDKVSNTHPEEISFNIHQRMKVGLLQPAAVSVYQYYEKDVGCVHFYNPQRTSGELLMLCKGDLCSCAEEKCSMQNNENIQNNQRTQKICESTKNSKIDFESWTKVTKAANSNTLRPEGPQILQHQACPPASASPRPGRSEEGSSSTNSPIKLSHVAHHPLGLAHRLLDCSQAPGLAHHSGDWLTGSWTGSQTPGTAHRLLDWLTDSWTGSQTPGLAHRLLDWLTDSWTGLTGSWTGSQTPGLAQRLLDWLKDSWTGSSPSGTGSQTPGLAHRLLDWLTDSWTGSQTPGLASQTPGLTHRLLDWLTGLPDWLTDSPTGSQTPGLAHRLPDWLTDSWTGSQAPGLAHRLLDWLTGSWTAHRLLDWLTDSWTGSQTPGLAHRLLDGSQTPGLAGPDWSHDFSQHNIFSLPETGSSHWRVPGSNEYTLEGTAYGLLALVRARELERAKPVVRWFSQQNRVDSYHGSYGSTQATIMVYQAVAEYWANAEEPEYDLNIDMTLPGKSLKLKFNKGSQFSTRTSEFNNINQDVTIVAEGAGEATVTMVSMYYALPSVRESNCQKFNLSVQVTPVKADEEEKVYKLTIQVMFKDPDHKSTMAIVDVGLPTGFEASSKDLDKMSQGHARTIQKYERNSPFSEKSNIIIYLDKVSNTHPEEISFNILQRMKVGLLQPAAVSVYQYYEKDVGCVHFYNPQRTSGELLMLCKGDLCSCAEEKCSMQNNENIQNNQRTQKICESTKNSKIDFAYKVEVEEFIESSPTDVYTVRIVDVIKEGNTDVAPLGKLRTFLRFEYCRKSVALTKGKSYLVMGSSRDINGLRDDPDQFQYVLGQNTWIEYWPTTAECQDQEHRPACLGITSMAEVYQVFGCQQ